MRRDFTINAMMYDYANEAIIDSVGGLKTVFLILCAMLMEITLEKILCVFSEQASLIARFDLKVEEKTKALITKMVT